MPDFFDHLWQQTNEPRSSRDRLIYLARLRALLSECPASCPIPRSSEGQPLVACAFDQQTFPGRNQCHQGDDLLFYYDTSAYDAFEPRLIREAKVLAPKSTIIRLDPLGDEGDVLESRCMGADAYTIDLSVLDHAAAQFLIEVGRDYDCPAIVICRTEEDLARALQVHQSSHILLSGVLAVPQILDLELLSGKTLWIDGRDIDPNPQFAKPSKSSHLILIQ